MFFKKLFGSSASSKGSAFSRLLTADERINDAKGKMVALKDSTEVKRGEVAKLQDEANESHARLSALEAEIDGLHAAIG